MKRLFDIIVSAIAIIISSPFLLIAAIAIKLESKGPVMFIQPRSGINGKPFNIYKLRTMVNDAHRLGPELTQKFDPRITKVGRFLRRTSIDELPQFINVLTGDMSIVGPRPEVPSITKDYNEYGKKVLLYKPGITGISAVNGRTELSIEEKLRMDIEYYQKATFWSDLLILIKTPWVVITNKGNVM